MNRFFKLSLATSLAAALGIGFGYMLSYTPPSYNSDTRLIPDSQKARNLVKKCEATTGYGESGFKSSWRLALWGNDIYIRCDIEEKIDYRERSRLDFCAKNPQKRYSWDIVVKG